MAESRRVPLTTLSCGRPSFSDVLVPSGGMQENRTTDTRTVRLDLKLFQPDEQKFPEFNYRQLLDDKTKKPENHQLNGFEQKEKRKMKLLPLQESLRKNMVACIKKIAFKT
ncbi:hypothetical protein OJAV_G00003440 [Oryzias javanicus]|uniref:Uncharacterized protein n=1 Tax=Oryzias javanicus TaxID=123683 RepID=A0A3S2Q1D4_ORYJA|nr:hypothetical protein OJAV_G00003440 [Oryzias javanicus]